MATPKKNNFEPKNISEYMAHNARNTVVDGAPKKQSPTQAKASLDGTVSDIETQLKESGDTVWVHNIAGSEYHIRPISLKGEDETTAIIFHLNEIKAFDPLEVKDRRFKEALLSGKLRIVKEKDVDMIKRVQDQAAQAEESNKYGSDSTGGLADSGLPVNKKMAKRYIDDTEDLDLLDSWAQKENRDNIIDYIEERIEDIENGEG